MLFASSLSISMLTFLNFKSKIVDNDPMTYPPHTALPDFPLHGLTFAQH